MAVVVHLIPLWRFWRRKGPRWYNALAFLIAQRLALLLAALFADRTLGVSRATARQLRSNGFPMRRVTAVACGVDLAAIGAVTHRPDVPRYDTVSVGRVAASKGVFELIDAWELVVAQKPDARLAVVGDGPDRQAVWERARRRGLAGNVDLLGAISTADKFQCIRACRLFALPSHEENWSIAIGEAMAFGVPVVAYDLPELLEVWGDAYRAVPEGDIPALANDILSLLEDEPVRRELTERGLARVSSLDWSAIAARELEWLTGDLADKDPLGVDPWLVASRESRGSSDRPHSGPPNVTAK